MSNISDFFPYTRGSCREVVRSKKWSHYPTHILMKYSYLIHSLYMWGYFHLTTFLTTFLTTSSRLPHDLRQNLTTFKASREVLVREIHPLDVGEYTLVDGIIPIYWGQKTPPHDLTTFGRVCLV